MPLPTAGDDSTWPPVVALHVSVPEVALWASRRLAAPAPANTVPLATAGEVESATAVPLDHRGAPVAGSNANSEAPVPPLVGHSVA